MAMNKYVACSAMAESLHADEPANIGRKIAGLLPNHALEQGNLTIKVSAFERGKLLVREYPDVKDVDTIGTAVKKALRWENLIDFNVDFLWSHGDDRVVVNLKIVG